MAWCQTGDKLLFDPMAAKITDAYMYMRHSASMNWWHPENNIEQEFYQNSVVSVQAMLFKILGMSWCEARQH